MPARGYLEENIGFCQCFSNLKCRVERDCLTDGIKKLLFFVLSSNICKEQFLILIFRRKMANYNPITIQTISPQGMYGPAEQFQQRQMSYTQESQMIVEEGATSIQTAIMENKSLVSFFHELIFVFAKKRQEIAINAQTPDAEKYGRLHKDGIQEGANLYTPLCGTYEKANKLAIAALHDAMSSIPHTKKDFIKTSKTIEEVVSNRHFSYQIEILSGQKLREREWDTPLPLEVLSSLDLQIEEVSESIAGNECNNELYARFKLFKTKYPDLYKRDRMFFYIKFLGQAFPSPGAIQNSSKEVVLLKDGNQDYLKSDYVLVTARTEIDKKMYATSQMLTWLYRGFNEDPFDRMARCSVTLVLHQDIYLNEASMNECANLFADILQWSPEKPVDELMEKVALLRYIFGHTMPFARGSAAIGEWLERSIYHHFGYSCVNTGPNQVGIDLLAITALSYKKYLQDYKRVIQISPL